MTAEPLIARLATHLQRPVPESVRTRARLHLLDWLACVAGARGSAVRKLLPVEDAFFGNVLEMDDVHRTALLHPGPVIWPTVMRSAHRKMDDFLDAAVRGYEAMITIGETFDAYHYSLWHPTATAGVFGAAAASASRRGLDATRTAWALANAGSVAGGLWHMRHDDVLTKQWHVEHAMRTGLQAAHWAETGLTGPMALLEGPQGLYAAMTKDPKPMRFTDGWKIEEVSFKPWAACRHAHPAIDCALELRATGNLKPPFMVETYADAITFCDRPDPTNENEAKFSLQHAIAVVADGRDAKPEDFTLRAISRLAALRKQVAVIEDRTISARYPGHFGARVNGFELVDCRGDPERPMSEKDLITKLFTLVEWGKLSSVTAHRTVKTALRGNSVGAVTDLPGLLLGGDEN